MRYTHAHGIDEPLAVWGGGSGLYGVVPHLSWRGGYEAGSNIETGALLDDGGTPAWIWPARYCDLNLAPDTRAPNPEPTRWLGSLIEGQVDLSGLAYRRNRYYNPGTGRFTQEDPIGLAGGLNLYGFASGDPVNFSDPFGLFQCTREQPQNCSFKDVIRNLRSGMASVTSPDGGTDTGPGFRTGQVLGLAGFVVPTGRGIGGAGLGDDALVVRGGSNTAERVAAGAEAIDAAGHVHGVSVNSANSLSVLQLSRGIPHNQIGVTTVGAIRAAGGRVVPDATRVNPHHCLVSCISAEALSKLLTPTIRNPAK